jgi:hypothetical protein
MTAHPAPPDVAIIHVLTKNGVPIGASMLSALDAVDDVATGLMTVRLYNQLAKIILDKQPLPEGYALHELPFTPPTTDAPAGEES